MKRRNNSRVLDEFLIFNCRTFDTEYIFLNRFSKWFCSKLEISELQKNPFRFVRCELFLYKEHRVRFTIRFIESKEEIES